MKFLYSLLVLSLFISCAKVEPQSAATSEVNFQKFIVKQSQYQMDKAQDIFLETPWYIYDENNHIIWPIFTVYALRTQGQYYKFQITDYYNSKAQPGHYSIRFENQNAEIIERVVEAQGCGNVYTNQDYDQCVLDPKKNIYTYLNIQTGQSFKTDQEEAKSRNDWHIAFNGTNVRINSGKYGPGDVRVANLFTYTDFFKNNIADFQKIAEVSFSDKGARFFNLELDPKNVAYSLPPGVDRIIYEDQWFRVDPTTNFHQATKENWWLVRGNRSQSYFRFNISNIEESTNEDDIETVFHFKLYKQSETEEEFNETPLHWTLPSFSSKKRLIRTCYDLDSLQIVNCKTQDWEIKFTALNRKNQRRWKIEVSSGAIGPLSEEDILARKSGRNL